MDLSRPHSAVAPSVEGDVLVALSGTTHPLTGRGVARLVKWRSVAGIADALDRLVRQGLVVRQDAPPAALYTLNRKHVAAPVVESMAGIRTRFLTRLRDLFATWSQPPLHASLFGSAARSDGALDSDIDLFLVRRSGVDPEDPVWSQQLADLSNEVMSWTGNNAGIIDFAEGDISELLDGVPPVLGELRRDGIDLAGTPLRELLGSAS